jgi:hypothetical protein
MARVVINRRGSTAAPTHLWAKLIPDGQFITGNGYGYGNGYGDGNGYGNGYGYGDGDGGPDA